MSTLNLQLSSKSLQAAIVSTVLCASLLYGLRQKTPQKMKIHKGLASVPFGPLQERAHEIYPEDMHGEGFYVNLPHGRVRYWLLGPTDGKKVWLVFGGGFGVLISIRSSSFTAYDCLRLGFMRYQKRLRRKGIGCYFSVATFSPILTFSILTRVLDLYGRGYTDAPDTVYDVNLYTIQTALLMQAVGWNKATIVGYSMVCIALH